MLQNETFWVFFNGVIEKGELPDTTSVEDIDVPK